MSGRRWTRSPESGLISGQTSLAESKRITIWPSQLITSVGYPVLFILFRMGGNNEKRRVRHAIKAGCE